MAAVLCLSERRRQRRRRRQAKGSRLFVSSAALCAFAGEEKTRRMHAWPFALGLPHCFFPVLSPGPRDAFSVLIVAALSPFVHACSSHVHALPPLHSMQAAADARVWRLPWQRCGRLWKARQGATKQKRRKTTLVSPSSSPLLSVCFFSNQRLHGPSEGDHALLIRLPAP